MILNPKDYPNLNGLFGNYEEDQKPDQKYQELEEVIQNISEEMVLLEESLAQVKEEMIRIKDNE
jgi:hypothetical protein